jgi:hypothetical protein
LTEEWQSADLADQIVETRASGNAVETILKTDAKVIARVTDGIYSQPASAFRELISNAYDADATRVVIQTDRPRFRRIVVSDDGHGMDAAAVAHLVEHIGGSAKRSSIGAELGVTGANPNYSPGGRRLIGKIGIGLFSVSQLTQSFQLITKVAGQSWRTVAAVTLKQYADDAEGVDEIGDDGYEAGLVSIWEEHAPDVDAHGTTIVLDGLKSAAREVMRSTATWQRVRRDIQDAPDFHIGVVRQDAEHEFDADNGGGENLPWENADDPLSAFSKLVDAVTTPGGTRRNPKLDDLLDYYLQMVLQLSLASPLKYVGSHPFDDELEAVDLHELAGSAPGPASAVSIDGSLAESRDWPPHIGVPDDFTVIMDDLELRRPIKFTDLPVTSNAVKTPMLFFGHLSEEFPGVDRARSGGPLEFYAYLMWTPKVLPVDHIGSMVRIHGASGTGFDESFFRYQVAETTRLRQISCEIFVVRGLEGALNIDRETYNFAHPHVVRLTNWLHVALSRAIQAQKSYGNALRRLERAGAARR